MVVKMTDDNKQRRHWVVTVHTKHVENEGLDNFDDWWAALCAMPGLRYACGQIELTEKGNLHIQGYTEWTKSLRKSELYNRLDATWAFRRGSRSEARDYVRLAFYHGEDKRRVRKLPEHGEWRKEGTVSEDMTPKQRALNYLLLGLKPADIARLYPDVYFTHHRAINELYRATDGIFECYSDKEIIVGEEE